MIAVCSPVMPDYCNSISSLLWNTASGVIDFVEIWKIVRNVPLYAFKNIISWLEMLLFGLPNFSFFISIFVFR